MKKMLFMAVFAAFAAITTATAQVEEKFPCYIEVSGYAESEVTPDNFILSIVLSEQDSKGRISVKTQLRDMTRALQKIGIDTDSQLTVVDMNSQFLKKNTSLLTAEYRLKLESATEVRNVYAVLNELGISKVSMRSMSYSKVNEVREQMRIEAIKNARKKALTLAETIGQRIGDCIRINDYSRDATEETVVMNTRMFKAAGSFDTADFDDNGQMEFRPIKVTGNVNARFVLLDGKGNNILYH